ncbi:aspartic peptidase domain-containing protein [Amylocarpus encephaloides]|uniref:Aspartic peptidase domain-containing protein n=1 Tax=Amylocarpus encephaloides TaxID=45428 RepID=A0A9P7Y9G4_9HELO|nr:aspartic peptidase domain-containing protein [Amylocarpus encephaloides]
MLLLKSLALLVNLVIIAEASYFYMPDWKCTLDKDCTLSKRDLEPGDALSPSLKVARAPESNKIENAQDSAKRLTRKYQYRSATHVNRDNSYKVVSAAAPSQTNAIGVDQDGTDYSYFVQVGIGSTNAPLYMLLDTGAGTTWVMGPSCTTDSCKSHGIFSTSNSKSFKDLNVPFNINYGSGNVSGSMGQDTIQLAGFQVTTSIGIAKYASDDFNHFPMDGILGLSLAKGKTPHFWETLKASKALKANLFGLDINRNSDGPNNGLITFGEVDNTRFTGEMKYYPLSDNAAGDWALPIGNVGIDSKQAGITGRVAYIDSGTSFIFGPPDDVKKFHALIPGASSSDGSTYSIPCDTKSSVTFTFESDTYNISPQDWVSPKVNGACTSNIYGVSVVDETSWLVGDTFLKNVYAVFDYDQSRLGFAAQAAISVTSMSSSASFTGQSSSPQSPGTSTSSSSSGTGSSSGSGSGSGSTGTGSSTLVVQSNGSSTGLSSVTATQSGSTTATSSSPVTSPVSPGLHGHETPVSTESAASAAAASGSATTSSPSETPKSSATQSTIFSSGTFLAAIAFSAALLV